MCCSELTPTVGFIFQRVGSQNEHGTDFDVLYYPSPCTNKISPRRCCDTWVNENLLQERSYSVCVAWQLLVKRKAARTPSGEKAERHLVTITTVMPNAASR